MTTSNTHSSHAVIIGASIAGLATARALSKHFEKVTLVERDDLQEHIAASTTANNEILGVTPSRKGVPQGSHGHGLLATGFNILHSYFPALMQDLVSQGANLGDITGDFLWHQFGVWKLRSDCGLRGIIASRPLLENGIRRHLLASQDVELVSGHEVLQPIYDTASKRVTGIELRPRLGGKIRSLEADLVVDASGRASRSPRWLEQWGFSCVEEELIRIEMGYASAHFERRSADVCGTLGAVIASTPPTFSRGGSLMAIEGGHWLVTLTGALRDYPPTDLESYRQFALSLPSSVVHEVIADRQPLTQITQHRFPANRRLRYERLKDFPKGYLVLGDAICSFNPVYGQGMSVGLMEAVALDDCLSAGRQRLSHRFFKKAAAIADNPWAIAAGEDLRYPSVEGKRPFGSRWINRYMERAHRRAGTDEVVLRRFFEVANLLQSPAAMLSPPIAWRVLKGLRQNFPQEPSTKS